MAINPSVCPCVIGGQGSGVMACFAMSGGASRFIVYITDPLCSTGLDLDTRRATLAQMHMDFVFLTVPESVLVNGIQVIGKYQ